MFPIAPFTPLFTLFSFLLSKCSSLCDKTSQSYFEKRMLSVAPHDDHRGFLDSITKWEQLVFKKLSLQKNTILGVNSSARDEFQKSRFQEVKRQSVEMQLNFTRLEKKISALRKDSITVSSSALRKDSITVSNSKDMLHKSGM